MMHSNFRLPVLLAIAALATPAAAEGLTDPTRPPPSVLSGNASNPQSPAESGPLVQMVSIGPTQRYALIGGRVVKVGSKVGESKVLEVRPDAVVLQAPDGTKETILVQEAVKAKAVEANNSANADASKGRLGITPAKR